MSEQDQPLTLGRFESVSKDDREAIVNAIRDLSKEIRGLVGASVPDKNGGGVGWAIAMIMSVVLSLFGTCIVMIYAASTNLSSQIEAQVQLISLERETRIANDITNERASAERHDNQSERLVRLERYHDEIVWTVMRKLGYLPSYIEPPGD